jgi:hypothetical protein
MTAGVCARFPRRTCSIAALLVALIASRTAAAQSGAAGCVSVTPVSAAVDTANIRNAIGAALAAGGERAVCLAGGTFQIDAASRIAGVSFDLGNPSGGGPALGLAIIGSGPGTILKLVGNPANTSWSLFQLRNGASKLVFRDFAIDGSAVSTTGSAQLFQIGTGDSGGVRHVTLDQLILESSPKDAVVILGSTSSANVEGVHVRRTRFLSNRQHGINVLHGTRRISVESSVFVGNVNKDIRASYAGGTFALPAVVDELLVAGNLVTRLTTHQPLSFEIYGSDATPARNIAITGNVLAPGRISIRNANQVMFAGNVVVGGAQASPLPDVEVKGTADYVTIADNTITRTSATGASALLLTHATGGLIPRRAVIQGNVVQQSTTHAIASIQSVTDVTVAGNFLGSTAASGTYGVQFLAGSAAMERIVVADNVVNGSDLGGSLISGFRFTPSSFAIGRVSITSNVVRGASHGVGLDGNAPGFSTIPVISDNHFSGNDIAGFPASSPVVAIGGNLGLCSPSPCFVGPAQFTGNGAPPAAIASAAVGSIYLRRDAVPSLYVRQPSGWIAK